LQPRCRALSADRWARAACRASARSPSRRARRCRTPSKTTKTRPSKTTNTRPSKTTSTRPSKTTSTRSVIRNQARVSLRKQTNVSAATRRMHTQARTKRCIQAHAHTSAHAHAHNLNGSTPLFFVALCFGFRTAVSVDGAPEWNNSAATSATKCYSSHFLQHGLLLVDCASSGAESPSNAGVLTRYPRVSRGTYGVPYGTDFSLQY
jgi:hypothetical protein